MSGNSERFTRQILCNHEEDGLRSGEGSIVQLTDGRLLLLYSAFRGARDHSQADIARMISADDGETWSLPDTLFRAPTNALNFASPSLLRLQDGRIGCIFCVKHSLTHLEPLWTASEDDGETWSAPTPILQESGYFLVNNDRLIQLQDGTLVIPYALHRNLQGQEQYEHFNPGLNAFCGLIYSLDGGIRWEKSPHQLTYTPEFHSPPLFLDESRLSAGVRYQLRHGLGVFQEPGVQELSNGRLMLYMRSSYAVFRAFSSDVSSPWQDCETMSGLHVCLGPQTIRRLPGSSQLIMLYNDRMAIHVGDPLFSRRTPLSIARSEDEGKSWTRAEPIEDDSHNYCYFSLLFFEGKFIASYYQSAKTIHENGLTTHRNLASLKICRGLTKDLFGSQPNFIALT